MSADIPEYDPKTATPEEITERMGQIDALVPSPNLRSKKHYLKKF